MTGRLAAAAWLALCVAAPAAALDATDIKPRPGLIITSTVFATVVSSGAAFGAMDTEDRFSVRTVDSDGIGYMVRMSSPGNQKVEEIARRLTWPRHVRKEDLEDSSRMTLLYSSTDPESYGGQTFAETSRKVLAALKTGGETPFVLGPYASSKGDAGALGALAQAVNQGQGAGEKKAPAPQGASGAPPVPDLGQMLNMLFGSARHYYRGTLRRVEPADVPVAVLVNGERVSLPAVHAAGTFTFGADEREKAEVWWLDNPDWPVTLHWIFGPANSVVTRIDWPAGDSGKQAGGGAAMAAQLASKTCRVELHGIYFNSGSAVLLEESEPMLKQVAEVIRGSPQAQLTIEGHTDNIGSAEYNQKLSEQRANAVRDALVTRYGVTAARLSAKGYGLTRPVETNATVEGRARNRRVELARPCAAT